MPARPPLSTATASPPQPGLPPARLLDYVTEHDLDHFAAAVARLLLLTARGNRRAGDASDGTSQQEAAS